MIVGYLLYDMRTEEYFERFGPGPDGRGIVALGTKFFHRAAKFDVNAYVNVWETQQLCGGRFKIVELVMREPSSL